MSTEGIRDRKYTNGSGHQFASATTVAAITLSDVTNNLDFNAIYFGEAGNAKVTVGGTDVTFSGIVAGTILPIRPTRVYSNGSTAFTPGTVIGLKW